MGVGWCGFKVDLILNKQQKSRKFNLQLLVCGGDGETRTLTGRPAGT